MCNIDVRKDVTEAGLKLWQIADKLGIRDNEFSRRLRKELPPEEKERIRTIIKELRTEKE